MSLSRIVTSSEPSGRKISWSSTRAELVPPTIDCAIVMPLARRIVIERNRAWSVRPDTPLSSMPPIAPAPVVPRWRGPEKFVRLTLPMSPVRRRRSRRREGPRATGPRTSPASRRARRPAGRAARAASRPRERHCCGAGRRSSLYLRYLRPVLLIAVSRTSLAPLASKRTRSTCPLPSLRRMRRLLAVTTCQRNRHFRHSPRLALNVTSEPGARRRRRDVEARLGLGGSGPYGDRRGHGDRHEGLEHRRHSNRVSITETGA